jgi:hypothetical protein
VHAFVSSNGYRLPPIFFYDLPKNIAESWQLFLVNLPYLFLFLIGKVADQFLLLQLFSCHRLLNKIFLVKAFKKCDSSFFKDFENLGMKPGFPVPDVGSVARIRK